MKTLRRDNDGFYKLLLTLALPMVLQNLIDAAVGMADTVMLGYVSQQALSATSLANNIGSITNMFYYGLCSGSSVLIAQYWGKKDTDTIERTIGLTLRFSLLIGIVFMLASILCPALLMTIYTPDSELIALGAQYLRIVGVGYIISAFTQVYIAAQRCMERVMFGTVVNAIALITNVILNACFIFGIGPFPKLDLVGVAYATVTSRVIALIICAVDASMAHNGVAIRFQYLFARKKQLLKDFIKYTLPALGNDFAWGLGISMYSVILGHLSSDIVAANSYANVVRYLATPVCFAVANSAAVIMGKTLGENNLEKGRVYGKRFMILSIVTGCIGGLAIAVCIPFITKLSLVKLNETAMDYFKFMLIISTINVVGQSVNTMLICGVFRSGGDANFGFILDTLTMWVYGVGIGALLAFVFKLPPKFIYGYLFMDEAVKMTPCFIRYAQKKWVKNITRDMASLD